MKNLVRLHFAQTTNFDEPWMDFPSIHLEDSEGESLSDFYCRRLGFEYKNHSPTEIYRLLRMNSGMSSYFQLEDPKRVIPKLFSKSAVNPQTIELDAEIAKAIVLLGSQMREYLTQYEIPEDVVKMFTDLAKYSAKVKNFTALDKIIKNQKALEFLESYVPSVTESGPELRSIAGQLQSPIRLTITKFHTAVVGLQLVTNFLCLSLQSQNTINKCAGTLYDVDTDDFVGLAVESVLRRASIQDLCERAGLYVKKLYQVYKDFGVIIIPSSKNVKIALPNTTPVTTSANNLSYLIDNGLLNHVRSVQIKSGEKKLILAKQGELPVALADHLKGR